MENLEERQNVHTLSAAQAQAILKFLSSAQLNGVEAPAFMECVMALRMIASTPPEPVSPTVVEAANATDHADATVE